MVLAIWAQCDHLTSGNNYNEEDKEITISAEIQEAGRAGSNIVKQSILTVSELVPLFLGQGILFLVSCTFILCCSLLLLASLSFPPAAKGEESQRSYQVD